MCAPACARCLHVLTCLAGTKHSEVALQHAFLQSVPKFAHVQCTALAGTYLGLVEKLPYLQALGINAIELLPIHEFNELEYHQARAPPQARRTLHGSLATLPATRSRQRLRLPMPAYIASAVLHGCLHATRAWGEAVSRAEP